MTIRQRVSTLGVFLVGVPFLATEAFAMKGPAASPELPFAFVENRGQAKPEVRFVGSGPRFKAWFGDSGVIYQQGEAVSRVRFVGAKPHPTIESAEPIGATANYFHGSDRGQWLTGLPLFNAIRYEEVWPGVGIAFRADHQRAKAEYLVSPGASAGAIRLRFDGRAEIQSDGSLVVSGESGEFREDKPILFQESGAGRMPVQGGFATFSDGTVGFTVEEYDHRRPLIIDPTITFSGYFGGTSQTNITAVAINSYYNTIVAGWTVSTDLPASGGARSAIGGSVDAFVAGFSPAGGTLVFCTYLGGSGDDRAFGVAVDGSNNTYVTGWTSSSNFPVAGAAQTRLSGIRDAFVAKLNPTGSALVYSTYLGGAGVDVGNAIALDSTNAALIVGDTTSTNLATTAGVVQSHNAGNTDVFVAKLSPSGASISFLTYFGGSGADHGASIKLDSSNGIFVGGSTNSSNFPTQNAFQAHSGGGQDGWVAKLSSTGTSIVFSSYLGGSGGKPGSPEAVTAVAVGPSGNLIVAGTTSSANFPIVAGAEQTVFGGGLTDGFVCNVNGSTGVLRRSTFVGGSGDDAINAVVVDASGNAIVAGSTTSADFPVQRPSQAGNLGGMDAFVLRTTYSQILFGTYLGGAGDDSANAIANDSLNNIVVAGSTSSGDFPTVGNIGGWSGSLISSFVTKLAPNFTLNLYSAPTFLFDVWHDTGYNGPNVTLNTSSFGAAGDIPVAGDWDGTGTKRIGVFRNGTWLLDINGNGVFDAGDKTIQFGQAGDLPVTGDWDGTGRIKLGLFRGGTFILDLSGHLSGTATGLSDATFSFGQAGDLPVASDWNRSGTTKVGVFRNGLWLVDYNGDQVFNGSDRTYTYGQAGDRPVVGDWTSTGVLNIGVYRQGLWILDYDQDNTIAVGGRDQYVGFGGSGYLPLVQ